MGAPKELCKHRPGFEHQLRQAGLDNLERLSARDLGELVTDRRTSWVRRTEIGTISTYVKTYDYPTAGDRISGAFRTTFFASSRAEREWQALAWMRKAGFPGPEPLAVMERRRRGVLRRAVLVTEAYPGAPMDRLLTDLVPSERDAALRALERLVDDLHRAGFRDRNLDLRNLLARRCAGGEGWEIAKIDSPRYRLTTPDRAHDRLAQEDWNRLVRSLRSIELL